MMNFQVRLPAALAALAVVASPFSTSGCEDRVIPVTQASMCQALTLPAVNPDRGPYTLRGFPLLHPEVDAEGLVHFRAPAVLTETELTLHNGAGTLVQRILVSPDAAQVDERLGLVAGAGHKQVIQRAHAVLDHRENRERASDPTFSHHRREAFDRISLALDALSQGMQACLVEIVE